MSFHTARCLFAATLFVATLCSASWAQAQKQFELVRSDTPVKSTAVQTRLALKITRQGNTVTFLRSSKYDAAGFDAYVNALDKTVILWPQSGRGAIQIGTIGPLGVSYKVGKMRVVPVGAPGPRPGPRPLPQPAHKGPVDISSFQGLRTNFLGKGRALDCDARGTLAMGIAGKFVGQQWRFHPVANGYYRITNERLGDRFSLSVSARDPRPQMAPTDVRLREQHWKVTPLTRPWFRITNEAVGDKFSLDNEPTGGNDPMMAATDNVTGQQWQLTSLGRIPGVDLVGSWVELRGGTTQATGVEIQVAPNMRFTQFLRGRPSGGGLVRCSGNQLTLLHDNGRREDYVYQIGRNGVCDLSATATGPAQLHWRPINNFGPGPGPAPRPVPRPVLISRKVIPNPPLAPAELTMSNRHNSELWVMVEDLRQGKLAKYLKIPPQGNQKVKLERDSGGRIVEVWEVPRADGQVVQQERVAEIQPVPYYKLNVYALVAASTYIDRTKAGSGKPPKVTKVPRGVGMIPVPPGDRFKSATTDIHAAAVRRKNPGAVPAVNLKDWSGANARPAIPDDPFN